MKKPILIFSILWLLFSCKDHKENPQPNQGTNAENKPNTSNKTLKLETFTTPEEISGCSCYFSKNQEEFNKEQYIYVDDYGNNAFLKINGALIKIPLKEEDFDPENFNKTIDNGDYKIIITGKKVEELDEVMRFTGEITVIKNTGEQYTSSIYGECGC